MPTALSTDLYELTMAAGYVAGGHGRATFDLYVRQLPFERSFLVAAGLEQVLAHLSALRFTQEEIAYLRSVPAMAGVDDEFFERYLAEFRFCGEVWAVSEGTPVFAEEPILTVTASIAEAQIVETALLAILGFQTSVATKAARVVAAAGGRPVVEFGGRRAHGPDAAWAAARAAFVGGCEATSNLEAGRHFGISVSGTMAHSWVMAHADEATAFRSYAELFGAETVLLLDTYDSLAAARRVVRAGLAPAAVRLDSGDLAALSRAVRSILDDGGLTKTRIFASGDLDEHRIERLLAGGAPIDGFGVGTALSTSHDAPALSVVYKLSEIERGGAWVPTAKRSPGKATWPGRKQVWRVETDGQAVRDLVGSRDEAGPPSGRALLQPVMRGGRRLAEAPALPAVRRTSRQAVERLPAGVRRLRNAEPYPVEISEGLRALVDRAGKRSE